MFRIPPRSQIKNVFNTCRPRKNDRHFADDILNCIFLYELRLEFHWNLFLRVQLIYSSIGSDHGLAPTRRQAIIWTDDGGFIDAYMRHSASRGWIPCTWKTRYPNSMWPSCSIWRHKRWSSLVRAMAWYLCRCWRMVKREIRKSRCNLITIVLTNVSDKAVCKKSVILSRSHCVKINLHNCVKEDHWITCT